MAVSGSPAVSAPAIQLPPDHVSDQEEILWRLERHARRYNEWILQRALPFVGESVLEVGAGIGTFSLPLAQSGRRVIANELDGALASILDRRVRRLPNVDVFRDDVLNLTPEMFGGPVDSVICFNVLEHIPEDSKALTAIRRCLRPGGQALLLVPAHPYLLGETDRAVDHQRRYARSGLKDLLTAAGFEIEEMRYVNPVGAAGWLVSSRLLRRPTLPAGPLNLFGRLVPVLRSLDRLSLPFGLSLWARAVRPAVSPATSSAP
jgi:SAM-dependent methyltransferase